MADSNRKKNYNVRQKPKELQCQTTTGKINAMSDNNRKKKHSVREEQEELH